MKKDYMKQPRAEERSIKPTYLMVQSAAHSLYGANSRYNSTEDEDYYFEVEAYS